MSAEERGKDAAAPGGAGDSREGEEGPSSRAPHWLDGPFFARVLGVPSVLACDVNPATALGENYASEVYKCGVLVAAASGGDGATGGDGASGGDDGASGVRHQFIVKCLPSNALRQMFCNKAEIFRKERDMYTRILPRYEGLLSSADPVRKTYPWPEYHTSEVDGERDYIVLKDLGTEGFSMADRMKGLDSDHLGLVLSALGEFHACSVALEALIPTEDFEAEVLRPFRELMYKEDNEDMLKWVEKSVLTARDTVESWGQAFSSIAHWITEWAHAAQLEMVALLRPSRGAVLCHGDAWLNNMLFRYTQEGSPTEIKLLDFQIARYASPVTDLLYLMVTSTTAVTRRKHWPYLLEHAYLRNFWKTLELLGVKESVRGDLYSMDWLLKEMKRFATWALFNALIVLRVIVLESKDAPDLDKLTEEDMNAESDIFKGSDDSAFQERLRSLICEFSEDGLFDS